LEVEKRRTLASPEQAARLRDQLWAGAKDDWAISEFLDKPDWVEAWKVVDKAKTIPAEDAIPLVRRIGDQLAELEALDANALRRIGELVDDPEQYESLITAIHGLKNTNAGDLRLALLADLRSSVSIR